MDHVRPICNEGTLPSGPHMLLSSQAEDHVVTVVDLRLREWSRKEDMTMLELSELGGKKYLMKFEMVLAAVIAVESLIGMFKRRKDVSLA